MKQERIKRIIFILAIIIIVCLIKATSIDAAETWSDGNVDNLIQKLQNGEKVKITNDDIKKSEYLFCKEFNVSNYGGNYSFKETTKYPIITYTKMENGIDKGNVTRTEAIAWYNKDANRTVKVSVEGADIAYTLNLIKINKKNDIFANAIQKVYWTLLPQNNNNSYSMDKLDDAEKEIYNEAKAYQNYVIAEELFKIAHQQETYKPIMTENNEIKVVHVTEKDEYYNNSNKEEKIGPFKIEYATATYNNQTFGAIKLNLVNSKTNEILTTSEVNESGIFLCYKDSEGNSKREKFNIDSNNEVYITTNVKTSFYIIVDTSKVKLEQFTLRIQSSNSNITADLYNLEGIYTTTSEDSLKVAYHKECMERCEME